MRALFLSRLNKQFRGWIVLSFLLTSLLGTHWIGFTHGIAHPGIHHQNIELSCVDQTPTLGHSSASCHLFDALTLAGFVSLPPNAFHGTNLSHGALSAPNDPSPARAPIGLYRSRAPPSFIL